MFPSAVDRVKVVRKNNPKYSSLNLYPNLLDAWLSQHVNKQGVRVLAS